MNVKDSWKQTIAQAINMIAEEAGIQVEIKASDLISEIPPKPEMGDLGFPMFSFAKLLRKGPPQIAAAVIEKLSSSTEVQKIGKAAAEGPYVNVFLNRGDAASQILADVFDEKKQYGRPGTLNNNKIMLEFSSPNTNKPLHLGHLRNDVLGESMSRILAACGAEVRKVCIINDRGIHICKSMLAYQEHGEGKTPESEHIKSDRFVGDWYVDFNKALKAETNELIQKGVKAEEAEAQTSLMKKVGEMLRKWEAGDKDTVELWKKMNNWAIQGMKETYKRTGVSFDKYYFESETYMLGKDEVLKGLEKGIFYKQEDGSVAVDLSAEKLDKKILLRSDGTSIYITQDFGTAIHRHEDWAFDKMIYVVGSEQQYHFKVLFILLEKLGYDWAKNLYHLSYGMVNLPEGKMKSREGTVVDADDLINNLRDMALAEIREKDREEEVGNAEEVAEKVALGALHYFLLQVSAAKDMLFDPKESLSFNGNTGPYLQYMGARISSMLRKAAMRSNADGSAAATGIVKPELLIDDAEWELIKTIELYPQAVADAAAKMDPSFLTSYLYEISKAFSRFYHDCPILNAPNEDLAAARLTLSKAVLVILKDAFNLVCIPFLEAM